MREVDVLGGQPNVEPILSRPRKTWRVSALGSHWRPPPGEHELHPVPGTLRVHQEGLAFEAAEATESTTGRLITVVIPLDTITETGPLPPGTRFVPSEPAGSWMPRWQRSWRSPGFWVLTSTGDGWAFESRFGSYRADFVRRTCMES